MGNNCMIQNQTINQNEKVIRIDSYSNLQRPSKQILHPQIQNLSQNLDTFEEDFFKNEFLFDVTNDNITHSYDSKIKLEKTDIDDIQQNITKQCPSLNFVGEQQIQYKINLNTIQEDPLNQAFIKKKTKKDGNSSKKSQKQQNKPVQKKLEPKGILKQNKQNSSLSSFSDRSNKHSVSFNLLLGQKDNKNTRSMSPIIQTKNKIKPNCHTKSMIFMQQFPYV
ncbi:unnamed protein product [Paramecium primaurelia]|uniref:Uncharacterized protein n=1 Tax=Paramecium primaurelia TaxID=5886 RepID=A0A8S1JS64_PARPR|nr:unnamed protein product [Paramecium primaurelia]